MLADISGGLPECFKTAFRETFFINGIEGCVPSPFEFRVFHYATNNRDYTTNIMSKGSNKSLIISDIAKMCSNLLRLGKDRPRRQSAFCTFVQIKSL